MLTAPPLGPLPFPSQSDKSLPSPSLATGVTEFLLSPGQSAARAAHLLRHSGSCRAQTCVAVSPPNLTDRHGRQLQPAHGLGLPAPACPQPHNSSLSLLSIICLSLVFLSPLTKMLSSVTLHYFLVSLKSCCIQQNCIFFQMSSHLPSLEM